MNYTILKENEPINLIEVSYHKNVPESFPNKTLKFLEIKKIYNQIFTDGIISKIGEAIKKPIQSYTINGKKYYSAVDTIKTKEIYIKGYSYILVYTIAKEWLTMGKITGFFDVNKDTSVYLLNPKDKQALKRAKQAIKYIDKSNYLSVNNSANTNREYDILYDKDISNIYTLKIKKH